MFQEDLEGLILLEVDFGDLDTCVAFAPPRVAGPEVTSIEAFTGGGLAGCSYEDLRPLIEKLSDET